MMALPAAYCVKFVAQKQQFVAGTSDGFIHVYNYGRGIQKIISFKSADYFDIRLVDHSTKSYVSSLSAGPIKLWGWNKGSPNLINENTDWKCTQTFEAVQYCLEWPAVFNPKDTNCFVVASDDFTIKV
jgi:coatomer subunit beta'